MRNSIMALTVYAALAVATPRAADAQTESPEVTDSYIEQLLFTLVPDRFGVVTMNLLTAAKIRPIEDQVRAYILRTGALNSKDHGDLIAAVTAMELVGTSDEVPKLIEIYRNVVEVEDESDKCMRRAVIFSLVAIYDPVAFAFLVEELSASNVQGYERWWIAYMLKQKKDVRLAPVFASLLVDANHFVTPEVAQGLVALGVQSVPALSEGLLFIDDYFYRVRASKILGEIGGRAAGHVLKRTAARDENEYVRAAARRARTVIRNRRCSCSAQEVPARAAPPREQPRTP